MVRLPFLTEKDNDENKKEINVDELSK